MDVVGQLLVIEEEDEIIAKPEHESRKGGLFPESKLCCVELSQLSTQPGDADLLGISSIHTRP